MCRELVNEFFLTATGQQLLMHQGRPLGWSSAVWSQLVCVCMCVCDRMWCKRQPDRLSYPLGVPTFSMRLAFSEVFSSSLCNRSLSLCSLAFSLSTVSIWVRWALPEVAWALGGPSTAGGLKELGGPWPTAAGWRGGECSWGCCRYWYCCCWRNTGGTWACRILGKKR